jgi:hypothetical protein
VEEDEDEEEVIQITDSVVADNVMVASALEPVVIRGIPADRYMIHRHLILRAVIGVAIYSYC